MWLVQSVHGCMLLQHAQQMMTSAEMSILLLSTPCTHGSMFGWYLTMRSNPAMRSAVCSGASPEASFCVVQLRQHG